MNQGPDCLEAKRFLETEIPKHKYTFTPVSSRTWPYYKALPLDAEVPLDSLLPPHSQVHQLIPYKASVKPPYDLVMVELYTASDTIPNYIVNIYHSSGGEPVLTGTSGPQVAEARHEMSLTLPETLLKSCIRYSFK